MLTIGKNIEKSIRSPSDFAKVGLYDEYRVILNTQSGETDELIFNLQSLVGHLKMCLVYTYKDLDPTKSCDELQG